MYITSADHRKKPLQKMPMSSEAPSQMSDMVEGIGFGQLAQKGAITGLSPMSFTWGAPLLQ
jgi:hypothetical protein